MRNDQFLLKGPEQHGHCGPILMSQIQKQRAIASNFHTTTLTKENYLQ